ncbi:hypothetical protein L486_07523 [Kwoniella mangroviensis CBS 10435]|uniref:Uncharacterized protein n=1 Tax=Kwoniella mangroviensis CBS 10435 TaxID=1331196 RepID=A0A1B9IGP7_9TREE|nr:hypothetical protein L486_07523 [Kwoniella mangroviensis CBS 10435]
MTSFPQRRSDQNSGHRRLFETYSPSSNPPKRIVVKRSTTLEDASKTLNRAGTLERLVERSYSSLQNEALAIEYCHTKARGALQTCTRDYKKVKIVFEWRIVMWSVIASMMEEEYEIQASK